MYINLKKIKKRIIYIHQSKLDVSSEDKALVIKIKLK